MLFGKQFTVKKNQSLLQKKTDAPTAVDSKKTTETKQPIRNVPSLPSKTDDEIAREYIKETVEAKGQKPYPIELPTFQNEKEAVEYALTCALRGRYALMFGTPDHLKPVSECCTKRGAAAMGMMLAGMEVGSSAAIGIASSFAKHTGKEREVEKAKKKAEERLSRLENVLKLYGVPMSIPKWNDKMIDRLEPRGRQFLMEMIPFWEESVAEKESKDAEKGQDVSKNREKNIEEVIAMANHIAKYAEFQKASPTKYLINFPKGDKEQGLPEEAVFEDDRWRINWPK